MSAPFTKSILVLANSMKKGGRCVAGIEVTPSDGEEFDLGGWIRPIDPTQDEGTIPYHRTVIGNRNLKPLDCVKIRFTGPANDPYHPEDVVIVTTSKWEQDGHFTNEVFDSLPDDSGDLWERARRRVEKWNPRKALKHYASSSLRVPAMLRLFVMTLHGASSIVACFILFIEASRTSSASMTQTFHCDTIFLQMPSVIAISELIWILPGLS